MFKRGVEANELVLVIIAAVVIIGIGTIANSFFHFMGKGSCELQTASFLGNLPQRINLLASPSKYLTRDAVSFQLPCGERAYFLDLSHKQKLLDSGALDDEPLIKDAVMSDTEDNFFVMFDNAIVRSDFLGKLDIDYPYHLCADTTNHRSIKLSFEGRGRDGVNVKPECSQTECTTVPELLSTLEINNLLNTACDGDAGCIATERANIENAQDALDIKLRVSSCIPEATKVEFVVTPKEGVAAKGVKVIETLPKECVNTLEPFLTRVDGGDSDVVIKPDPMIVWSFDTVREEETVVYHLSKLLEGECRKKLRAVVSAEMIVKSDSAKKDIDEIKREDLAEEFVSRLEIRGVTIPVDANADMDFVRQPHPDRFDPERGAAGLVTIQRGQVSPSDFQQTSGGNTPPRWVNEIRGLRNLENGIPDEVENIWNFASDSEQDSKDLAYVFIESGVETSTVSRDFVKCSIVGTGEDIKIRCEPENAQTGSEIFNVRVKDNEGQFSDTQFEVRVS